MIYELQFFPCFPIFLEQHLLLTFLTKKSVFLFFFFLKSEYSSSAAMNNSFAVNSFEREKQLDWNLSKSKGCMDWKLRDATSWNLPKFVEEPSFHTINGSPNGFSVDLKLGPLKKWKEPPLPMESSSSSSSKRARASNNNGSHQQVWCLVDGCSSELSKCKDYYRRNKVCQLHSKAAQVFINGKKQRFCQQCSRYVQRWILVLSFLRGVTYFFFFLKN